jgi:cellulose synthase/poly-beta-1,6-N-acetylglucosamine synthase-like glycosyltransferase
MTKPIVSVVMVTCDVDRFLAESIESILGQTFRDFEFVIADFGSTDKSKSIISDYAAKDSRIKFYEISHRSLAKARNAGCFLAQGEYIAVADADDVSDPNRLQWEVEFLEKHPQVGALGGAVEWIDSAGRSLYIAQHPVDDREIRSALLTHSVLWHPTALIRNDAFISVGGYRPVFVQAEDYDLWLRIAQHFQLANLDRVVLKYRIHPNQISMRERAEQTFCVLAAQFAASSRREELPDPLDSAEAITPAALAGWGVTRVRLQRALFSDRRQWIRHMCMAGEYSVALQAAIESLQSDLKDVEPWQVADLELTVAQLYWRRKEYAKSFLAVTRALATRPLIVGRPIRSALRRFGLLSIGNYLAGHLGSESSDRPVELTRGNRAKR